MRSAFAFTRLVSSALVFAFIFTQAAPSYALRATQTEEEQGVDRQNSIQVQLQNALTRLASAVGWVSPAAPVPTVPVGRTVEVSLAAAGLEEQLSVTGMKWESVTGEGIFFNLFVFSDEANRNRVAAAVGMNPAGLRAVRQAKSPNIPGAQGNPFFALINDKNEAAVIVDWASGSRQLQYYANTSKTQFGEILRPEVEISLQSPRVMTNDQLLRLSITSGLGKAEGRTLRVGELFKRGDILVNLTTGKRQYQVTKDQVTSIEVVVVESLMDQFSSGSFPAAIMRTFNVVRSATGLEEGEPLGDKIPAKGDVIINPTRRLFGRFVVQPRLAVGRAMKGDAQDPVISLVKEGAAGQAATPIELRLSLIDKNARLITTAGLEDTPGIREAQADVHSAEIRLDEAKARREEPGLIRSLELEKLNVENRLARLRGESRPGQAAGLEEGWEILQDKEDVDKLVRTGSLLRMRSGAPQYRVQSIAGGTVYTVVIKGEGKGEDRQFSQRVLWKGRYEVQPPVPDSSAGLEEGQPLTAETQLFNGNTVYLTGDLKQAKIVASTSRAVRSRRVVLFEGEGSQAWRFQDELAAAGATFARTSDTAAGLEERVLLLVDDVPGRITYDTSIKRLETSIGTFLRAGVNTVDQIAWGNTRRAVAAVADNGYVEVEIDGDTARIKAPTDWTLVRRMSMDEVALAINYDTTIETLVTPAQTFSRAAGEMAHLNMQHAIGNFASAGQVSWKVAGDTATILAPAAGLEGVQGALRKLNATTQFWKSVEVSLSITARPILVDASDDARVRHVAQALSVMLANDNVPELDFRLVIPEALVSDMIKELATINPETATQFLSPRVIAYDGTAKTREQARLEATQTLARRFGFGSSQQLLQAGVLKVVEQLTPQLALELRAYFEAGGLRFVSSEAFERLKALLEAA